MRDTFFSEELRVKSEELKGVNPYEVMDREAASSEIGARGIFFHPYLQGERCPYWDANLRASFTGVSIASTRGDFCRALLEGVAFSLRDCYGTQGKGFSRNGSPACSKKKSRCDLGGSLRRNDPD